MIRIRLRFSADCRVLLFFCALIIICALPSELEIQERVVAVSYQCDRGKDQQNNRTNNIVNINRIRYELSPLEPCSGHLIKPAQQRRGSNDCKNQEKDIVLKGKGDLHIGQTVSVKSYHAKQHGTDCVKILKFKQHPTEVKYDKRVQMRDGARQGLKPLQEEKLLQYQKYEEPESPQYIVPAGAVPETGQEPDDEQIQNLSGKSQTVAAKRDVQIVPEPR